MIEAYHASRGEGASQRLPDPGVGARHQSRVGADGRHARRRRRLRRRRQRRPRRPRGARPRAHARDLAAIMVTYPSTHGVFEAGIGRICEIVHAHGGQVYVDGANLNALVGLAAPGALRRRRLAPQPAQDVLHPARRRRARASGRSRCKAHLAPFLPGHRYLPPRARRRRRSARSRPRPYGSASILPISWMYIAMMGGEGLARATESAILAANYIAKRLDAALPGAVRGAGRARRARVHPRPAAAEGDVGHRGRGRRQAPDRLRLPRADDELPGRGHADGRADRERIEGRARPLHRRDDRDPRRDPRDRGRPRRPRRQSAEARAAHGGGGRRRRLDARVLARGRGVSGRRRCAQAKYWPPVARVDNVYGDRNLFCSCPPVGRGSTRS